MQHVCAVLVSHNRKSLLRESLQALREQTRPVQGILVVDNASTDGTSAMLAEQFPQVAVLRFEQNAGSSGGYHAAIGWAFDRGYQWIWTLDDDSIAHPDALAKLLHCRERFDESLRPDLLASRVLWADQSLHPMNIQKPKLYGPDLQLLAAGQGAMSIRFTSFVSMLIHRRLIERYGLPIPGFFLWNDDVEYSARLLRREFGVVVPDSVVVHKTAFKHVPATDTGGKYFYEIRNKLWILRHSQAFDRAEKWWMLKSLVRRTVKHLRDSGFSRASTAAVMRGLWQGVMGRPSSATPVPVAQLPIAQLPIAQLPIAQLPIAQGPADTIAA